MGGPKRKRTTKTKMSDKKKNSAQGLHFGHNLIILGWLAIGDACDGLNVLGEVKVDMSYGFELLCSSTLLHDLRDFMKFCEEVLHQIRTDTGSCKR
jgi:hypothetical protein